MLSVITIQKVVALNHIAFVMFEKPRNSKFWSNSPKWLTIRNDSP